MHVREVVFEPLDSKRQREMGMEPNVLRCGKDLLEPDSGWCVLCASYAIIDTHTRNEQGYVFVSEA